MGLKEKITDKIESFEVGRKLLHNPRHRVIYGAAFGLFINLLYAVYNGAPGVLNRSVWFVSMCAYYVILSVMRFSAVMCGRQGGAPSEDTEFFVMRLTGGAVCAFVLMLGAALIFKGIKRRVKNGKI